MQTPKKPRKIAWQHIVPIIAALIGAAAVILAAIIGGLFLLRSSVVIQPTPTPTPTPQNIYNQVTSEIPALSNTLSQNDTKNWSWIVYNNHKDSACEFTGGAYHAIALLTGYKYICPAYATNFSNFAFQVQMRIIKGDCGGLFFRGNSDANQYYFFAVCQDGTYEFSRYDVPGEHTKLFVSSSSQLINTGLNQSNLIAILANQSQLSLYVNNTFVYGTNDGTYTHGQIGVASVDTNNITEVIFSNAKVWTL